MYLFSKHRKTIFGLGFFVIFLFTNQSYAFSYHAFFFQISNSESQKVFKTSATYMRVMSKKNLLAVFIFKEILICINGKIVDIKNIDTVVTF